MVLRGPAHDLAAEFLLIADVAEGLALLNQVEGRLRDIDVTAFDELVHLPIEERQQQGANVGAVHIGISHDDDLAITQLGGDDRVPVWPTRRLNHPRPGKARSARGPSPGSPPASRAGRPSREPLCGASTHAPCAPPPAPERHQPTWRRSSARPWGFSRTAPST